MNATKQCKDRFDDIVALVMGELDSVASHELQEHLALCERCRAAQDDLAAEEKEIRSGFEAFACSLGPIERSMLGTQQRQTKFRVRISNDHFFERVKHMILAHKRLSVAATAAMTGLAAGLILYVSMISSPTAAYALEQTAEANSRITSYHVRTTPTPIDHACEVWIELNTDGTLSRVRTETFSASDGLKVSIASKDKCEVWFKIKHTHVVLNDKDMIRKFSDEIMASRVYFDPKLVFEQLQADEKAGKVHVETREPIKDGQPITLTVTSKEKPDQMQIYEVDPETKLAQQVIELRRQGDQWKYAEVREYLDYNKQFDPKVFQLDLPKGTVTVDRIKTVVGLDKGDLTDDQIATRVAREFFEAMIAGDYQKAGQLYSGIPAEQLERTFARAQIKFLRIVEIGKPLRGEHPDKQALKVPVKLEMSVKGQNTTSEISPYVRPESGRWVICGGI